MADKALNFFRLLFIGMITVFSSCGEDRSGEYYALIEDKTWIYETMQEKYLFYQDLPSEEQLDFFMSPADFVKAAASNQDQKNGVVFSHADSVNISSRAKSEYPCFGFEVDFIISPQGSPVMRVLYVESESPAEKAELKRGDWIIAVDNEKVSTNNYGEYIVRPTQSHKFTIGKYIPRPENEQEETEGEEEIYTEFDTLRTVNLTPAYVEIKNVLVDKTIDTGNNQKALYILYNSFGEDDSAELKRALTRHSDYQDVILDLRYNPGGYVNTAQLLCTYLAPTEAMGDVFLNMVYNDKINKTETWVFDQSLLKGTSPLTFRNLYIITSGSTASASEIVINCLKPYLKGKLYQVGAATFGKNVAQQCFTNENVPQIELWLTTTRLSNSEKFSDYFENGLLPDYEIEENTINALGEFGTFNDRLLQPVFHHIQNGSFPANETDETPGTTSRITKRKDVQVIYSPLMDKPKWNKLRR